MNSFVYENKQNVVWPQAKWENRSWRPCGTPQKHGYIQAKNTNGLFVHDLWDISFTLVVKEFGIKYTNKDDVNHLISVMRGKYKFNVNFDAKQYIEIHLKWNYVEQNVRCSMKEYFIQALEELKQIFTAKHY